MCMNSLDLSHDTHLVMEVRSQTPPEDKHCHGSKSIVPLQASPYLLGPRALVCYLLLWRVQYIVYPWGWDLASETMRYHCIAYVPNWNNLPEMEFRQKPLRYRGLWRTPQASRPRYQDLDFANVDRKSPSFPVSFPDDQLFCISSSDSERMTRHLLTGFPRDILLGEDFQDHGEQWETQARALENTHFHTEIFTQVATDIHSASGIFIHALYDPYQPLLNATFTKSPPDDMVALVIWVIGSSREVYSPRYFFVYILMNYWNVFSVQGLVVILVNTPMDVWAMVWYYETLP